jgi:Domain of unknown function DUF29
MAEPEPLYDADILLWSEQQAELLRRRAANALDWDNLAEEIGDVGRSELHSVMSHLRLALLHDLKAEAWPGRPTSNERSEETQPEGPRPHLSVITEGAAVVADL